MPEFPTVILLHGDDAVGLMDRAQLVLGTVGIGEVSEFNFQRFDGDKASLTDIRSAAYTLPFFTPRRAVMVFDPLSLTRSDTAREQFISLLQDLPETTTVVLVQPDEYQSYGRDRGWKNLRLTGGRGAKGETILGWVKKNPDRANYEEVKLPGMDAMPRWIIDEARRQGGEITPAAASLLTQTLGSDTGIARMELTKLLNCVDFARAVTSEDVQQLTPQGGQSNIFSFTDSLAAGDSRKALAELGKLLRESDPNEIFFTINRHFRTLLLAKEVWSRGVRNENEAASLLGVSPYPAKKALEQSKRFTMPQLEGWYRSLLELDRQNKSSEVDLLVGLQTLISRVGLKEKA